MASQVKLTLFLAAGLSFDTSVHLSTLGPQQYWSLLTLFMLHRGWSQTISEIFLLAGQTPKGTLLLISSSIFLDSWECLCMTHSSKTSLFILYWPLMRGQEAQLWRPFITECSKVSVTTSQPSDFDPFGRMMQTRSRWKSLVHLLYGPQSAGTHVEDLDWTGSYSKSTREVLVFISSKGAPSLLGISN